MKLVVSDLDGTLLQKGETEISQRMLSIIERLGKKDILFAAASGRQYSSIRRLFRKLNTPMLYICENGSVAIEADETLFKNTLDREEVFQIIEDVSKFPGTDALLSGERVSYILEGNPFFYNLIHNQLKNEVVEVKDFGQVEEEFVKIAIYFEIPGVEEEAQKTLSQKYQKDFEVAKSGLNWVDFIKKESGKGWAVQKVMERLQINPEEILLFGDNENDISMLTLTSNSYAMEHATEKVKQHAGHTCKRVEDVLEELEEIE